MQLALRWWLTAPTHRFSEKGGDSGSLGEEWLLSWSRFYHSLLSFVVITWALQVPRTCWQERERGRAMILLLYFSTLLLVTWRPRYCYYHYCMLCYVIWRSCFVSPFLSARYRNMFCSYSYDIQLQSWLQHQVSRCSYSWASGRVRYFLTKIQSPALEKITS